MISVNDILSVRLFGSLGKLSRRNCVPGVAGDGFVGISPDGGDTWIWREQLVGNGEPLKWGRETWETRVDVADLVGEPNGAPEDCQRWRTLPCAAMFEGAFDITVSVSELASALKWVSRATDEGATRFTLAGVAISIRDGVAELIGTDGRRLHCHRLECHVDASEDIEVVVLPSCLEKILKYASDRGDQSLTLSLDANRDGLSVAGSGDWVARIRLVEGRFPAWRQVIPQTTDSIAIPAEFRQLVANTKPRRGTKKVNIRCKVVFSGGKIIATEFGDIVPAPIASMEWAGPAILKDIAFDLQFLKDALGAESKKSSEPVVMRYRDTDKYSAWTLDTKENRTVVIMPMVRD